jgi:hypothetical protein
MRKRNTVYIQVHIYLPAVNATLQNICCRNRHHFGAALWRGSSEREDCQNTTVRSAGSRYVYCTCLEQCRSAGGGGEYITTILIGKKGQGGQMGS